MKILKIREINIGSRVKVIKNTNSVKKGQFVVVTGFLNNDPGKILCKGLLPGGWIEKSAIDTSPQMTNEYRLKTGIEMVKEFGFGFINDDMLPDCQLSLGGSTILARNIITEMGGVMTDPDPEFIFLNSAGVPKAIDKDRITTQKKEKRGFVSAVTKDFKYVSNFVSKSDMSKHKSAIVAMCDKPLENLGSRIGGDLSRACALFYNNSKLNIINTSENVIISIPDHFVDMIITDGITNHRVVTPTGKEFMTTINLKKTETYV